MPEISYNAERLKVLRDFNVLDSGAEKVYDDITALAAEICEMPICLVSLVEKDRQWFKSEVGLGFCETPIEQSICVHALAHNDDLEIEDTLLDPCTQNNSLCQGENPIRFYAGAVLRSLDGWPLGTLCVLDFKPRKLTPLQKQTLKILAKSVAQQLELTRVLVDRSEGQNIGIDAKSDANDEFRSIAQERYKILTPREKEIMGVMTRHSGNLSSKQIGEMLSISHRTVDHHRASILAKMKVDSVAELIAVSIQSGLSS